MSDVPSLPPAETAALTRRVNPHLDRSGPDAQLDTAIETLVRGIAPVP